MHCINIFVDKVDEDVMCLRFWCTDVPFPWLSDRVWYVPTNKPLRCTAHHDDDDHYDRKGVLRKSKLNMNCQNVDLNNPGTIQINNRMFSLTNSPFCRKKQNIEQWSMLFFVRVQVMLESESTTMLTSSTFFCCCKY